MLIALLVLDALALADVFLPAAQKREASARLDAAGARLDAIAKAAGRAGSTAVKELDDWVHVLLEHTSAHEGTYSSVQENLDGQGVSYGILQWTQRGGGLGEVLAAMRAADPAQFAQTFGAPWPELLAATAAQSLEPVAGALLWREPWLSRFRAAGRVPAFQAAQVRLASQGPYMRAAATIAGLLGVKTERAMALYFNRTVHQGAAGATAVARDLARWYAEDPRRRPSTPAGVLAQYGWKCAAQFRRTSPPSSPWKNSAHTVQWVQLAPGSLEYDLDGPRLVRRQQSGPTWHAVTGPWDLWDLIIKRTDQLLNAGTLRDVDVDLRAVA